MSPLLLYIVLLVTFLALSVFFSAAETAFMAVNRLRLKYQADAGDEKAKAIKKILDNPDRILGVILLGVTVAEIAAASLLTYLITFYADEKHVRAAGLIGSILLSLVILIFCELTPKIIAAARPEQTARALLVPVQICIALLSRFAALAAWIANGLVRMVGLHSTGSPFAHTLSEDEIKAMIAGSSEESVTGEKKEMLHNIFEIGATQIREIMIPRIEVTAVEINDPMPKILEVINKTNYSRIPVYRGNFDNPIGILNVKDLLQHVATLEGINLQVLLRPVHFVPDTARLDIVLRQLQSMHLHMAVVVDEYGGVEGIVTLEDLLEEIVGEIRDEHDTEIEAVRELGPNLYSIAGNFPVRDFNRVFNEKIPESPAYTSLAGFLEALTGRLLREGESVRYRGTGSHDREGREDSELSRYACGPEREQKSGARSQKLKARRKKQDARSWEIPAEDLFPSEAPESRLVPHIICSASCGAALQSCVAVLNYGRKCDLDVRYNRFLALCSLLLAPCFYPSALECFSGRLNRCLDIAPWCAPATQSRSRIAMAGNRRPGPAWNGKTCRSGPYRMVFAVWKFVTGVAVKNTVNIEPMELIWTGTPDMLPRPSAARIPVPRSCSQVSCTYPAASKRFSAAIPAATASGFPESVPAW